MDPGGVSDQVRLKLKQALEAAGVVFLSDNGGGVGVRFRRSRSRIVLVIAAIDERTWAILVERPLLSLERFWQNEPN